MDNKLYINIFLGKYIITLGHVNQWGHWLKKLKKKKVLK